MIMRFNFSSNAITAVKLDNASIIFKNANTPLWFDFFGGF
jgi:hypothetical protein